jgi:hypothetical protein
MGLRKEHSASLFNEEFLLESRYRAGCPFNEGFFYLNQIIWEKLDPSSVQQMQDVAPNQCWKPMSFSRSRTLNLLEQ